MAIGAPCPLNARIHTVAACDADLPNDEIGDSLCNPLFTMSIATLDEVAIWDEDGHVEGLQFDCRERRIQEWREKKEAEEFDRLIARLRQHNNYRKWYEKRQHDPEFRKKMREHCRRMRRIHGERRYAEAREQRKREADENPIVNVCEECQEEFTIGFGYKKKRTSRFCGKKCRNRFHNRERTKRRQAERAGNGK